MVSIKIVTAEPEHIRVLLKELEKLNNEDAYRFGMDEEEVLLKVYRSSIYKKTAIVNDKVIAVWGCLGDYLGELGRPWSIMSPETEKYPYRVKSFYSYEIDKMLQLFPRLIDMVDAKHKKVLRMLKLLGFTSKEPELFMGIMFIRAERRI